MIRRNFAGFVILAAYLLCIFVANPSGEFPLNDDWSYTRSAFALGAGQGLKIDPWSAPSLVGQVLYGGLLTKLFSQRFLVLRASTLALSCCTALLLWAIFRRAGFGRRFASLFLLCWIFNPFQFSLSFTYMTEIPFLFFIALALYLYTIHLDTGNPYWLLLSTAALGYAFLIRQTALFFILGLFCSLLLDRNKTIWVRVRQAVPLVLTAGIFILGYAVGSHSSVGATVAVQRKFDLLGHLRIRQFLGNSYGMLFYLAFMLLPIWILLVPHLRHMMGGLARIQRMAIPAVSCVIVATGLWWFHASYKPAEYIPATSYHARMPFLLNVLYDTGLGPLTLDPDYFASPPMPSYPWLWYGITGLVAAGAIAFLMFAFFAIFKMRARRSSRQGWPLFVFAGISFLLLMPFEIVFSHLQEGGLFDRHILIVAFPLMLIAGLVSAAEATTEDRSRKIYAGTWAAIVLLGVFSVAATHDYMQWNRIRWQMGRQLLRQGIDPLSIVGGFEFNAWNNYDTYVARGRTAQVSHWWYDRRDYIITMIPMDGYEIRQTQSFYSWVHRRPIAIYLIADSKLATSP